MDVYDTPAFLHYWRAVLGQPGALVLPEQALGEDQAAGRAWQAACASGGHRPGAVAANLAGARRLLRVAGILAEPVPAFPAGDRTLYLAGGWPGEGGGSGREQSADRLD